MDEARLLYKTSPPKLPTMRSKKNKQTLYNKNKPSASASIASVHISSDDEDEIVMTQALNYRKKSKEYLKLVSLLEPQKQEPEIQRSAFEKRVHNLCVSLYDDVITLKPEFFIDIKEEFCSVVKKYPNKKVTVSNLPDNFVQVPDSNLPENYVITQTSADLSQQLQQQLSAQNLENITITDGSGVQYFTSGATNEAGEPVFQIRTTNQAAIDNLGISAKFTQPQAQHTPVFDTDSNPNPGHQN